MVKTACTIMQHVTASPIIGISLMYSIDDDFHQYIFTIEFAILLKQIGLLEDVDGFKNSMWGFLDECEQYR